METVLRNGNAILTLLFFLCYAYQFVYIPFGLRKTDVSVSEPLPQYRFAVLIAARNEETVIDALLASIAAQTYPVCAYVIADNCTDRTAEIARRHGAKVYERHDTYRVGKGYALDALLRHIRKEGEAYDGYFVFDADNLLAPNYVEEMAKTYAAGHEIITSYRMSRNFAENWISAGYALWFLRESRYLNGARMALKSSCAVSGTGFFFSRRILEKNRGWPFHLLTEDIEFSIHELLDGERIAYCSSAVFYDEQPADFRISCRQRLRWARGYLQVFRRYGAALLRGIAAGRWACFDMAMAIMPAIVLTAASLVCNTALAVSGLLDGSGIAFALWSLAEMAGSMYIPLFIVGAITMATEWSIIDAKAWKKLLYVFTFPLFMFTYIPLSFAALFCRVQWKPIPHTGRGMAATKP